MRSDWNGEGFRYKIGIMGAGLSLGKMFRVMHKFSMSNYLKSMISYARDLDDVLTHAYP